MKQDLTTLIYNSKGNTIDTVKYVSILDNMYLMSEVIL